MRNWRAVLAVVIAAVIASGCGSSGELGTDGARQLRGVGVHVNQKTGLVAVVEHDVTLEDNKLPKITVTWGYTNREIPETIPEVCTASVSSRDDAAVDGFPIGMQFTSDEGGRLRLDQFITWSAATIMFGGCGALDGAVDAQTGVFDVGASLPAGTASDSVWTVIPIFGQFNVKGPSSMPARLMSEILASNSGATAIVFADIAVESTDLLADDIDRLTRPLPRSTVDRPDDDPGQAQVKFIYVVPTFSDDRGRDTSGEISRFAAYADEWWSLQNAGFGLRLDTYDGAVDVGYLPLDITREQWNAYFDDYGDRSLFRNGLAEFQDVLADAGWGNIRRLAADVDQGGTSERDAQIGNGKLYMIVIEAPAGTYGRTGAPRECISMIDAINDRVPIIGFAQSTAAGASCGTMASAGRFPATGSVEQQTTWVHNYFGAIDHVAQWMRSLPGCGFPATPKDGERVKIPGVVDPAKAWEIRGGFMRDLAEPNDPVSDGFSSGAATARSPQLDPRHDLYFHITSDKLAPKAPCNSDISRHPLWDDKPFDRDSTLGLPRTSYDRPDDVVGAQLKAVYALKQGAQDRWFDTRGDIESAMRQMQAFVEASTDGANTVRIDTFNGRPDIMYFPVPESVTKRDPATCVDQPCPNDQSILQSMKAAGRLKDGKQYMIFFDGGIEFTGQGLCGGSAQGRASMINLMGITSDMCDQLQFSSTTTDEWSVGLLSLHELFHALGAVCDTAANSAEGMHSTAAGDMMGARAQGRVSLDPGKTYWFNAPRGCIALSTHPLFARTK